ncbi:ribosome maturation factor RimM [Aliifodinibius sp. S!AR15-10]|uniref:ribosome maturation factor RimM n=1 Tax=Aliifodinibius sp. S!AR15-10 TaxID=2950437 RepID=UPI00285C8B7A|nr:ribosome maturation factor RimM [Aliifodinibius sp. S!AR15-10]MDR8393141.1 ribosome maturation factor RimM [Aliifodinibius sp. S!AR15-10]
MLEPIANQYLLIGYVNRSHGVHGEVLIIPEVEVPTLFEEIDIVHLQNSRGDLIPARIESFRVQEKQNRLSFFVKFEHVADRNEAEQIKNCPVYVNRAAAENLIDQPATVDLTDYEVYDEQDQQLGKVEFTIDNPAHPILQVSTDDDRQLLIPFVDEYIVTLNEEDKIIRCQNLDQLEGL